MHDGKALQSVQAISSEAVLQMHLRFSILIKIIS